MDWMEFVSNKTIHQEVQRIQSLRICLFREDGKALELITVLSSSYYQLFSMH